jgi:ABC-type dipeptide/oligopeptide/nickel transport system permease subunit
MFGLCVVLLFITMAIFAPLISPFDPIEASWSAIRKAPTSTHWFGTDELGRDVLARVIWGARASLLAGVVSVAISLLTGVTIGMLAGFLGGTVDSLISRATDAFLACPFFFGLFNNSFIIILSVIFVNIIIGNIISCIFNIFTIISICIAIYMFDIFTGFTF